MQAAIEKAAPPAGQWIGCPANQSSAMRGVVRPLLPDLKAPTLEEIAEHEVMQQGRFAGTGLADNVEMPAQIAARQQPKGPREFCGSACSTMLNC